MTEHRINCPDWLWESYKTTVNGNQRLEEPLLKCVAERVAESDVVEDDLNDRAEQYLEVQGWD